MTENNLKPWFGRRVIIEIPEQGKLPIVGHPKDWLDADEALREAEERGYLRGLGDRGPYKRVLVFQASAFMRRDDIDQAYTDLKQQTEAGVVLLPSCVNCIGVATDIDDIVIINGGQP